MLKRRVLEPVRFVAEFDPAIDPDGSDYAAFTKTWDAKHLKCKAGESFTVFVLSQLTDQQRDAAWRMSTHVDRCAVAIKYGLLDVENYGISSPVGEVTLLETPSREAAEFGSAVKQEWLTKARLLTEEKFAIGSAILAITEARPPLS